MTPIWKWALAILGTILLGALGSGLWDAIFRPLLPWLGELLLNVGTLGLEQLRDGIYVEVARGTYERAGLLIVQLVIGGFAAFLLGIVSGAGFRVLLGDRGDPRQELTRST